MTRIKFFSIIITLFFLFFSSLFLFSQQEHVLLNSGSLSTDSLFADSVFASDKDKKKIVFLDTIVLKSFSSGTDGDSLLVLDPVTGVVRIRRAPSFRNRDRGENFYNSHGNLTGDRVVSQGRNTLSFTATGVNAFNVDNNTFSVDAANDRVGIGTNTPSTALQVKGVTTTDSLSIRSLAVGSASDSVLVLDAATGNVRMRNASSFVSNSNYRNIYRADGMLNSDRVVSQGSNTLSFTATGVNAFNVDNNTFSVDAANNRVGIGTNEPMAILDVAGVPCSGCYVEGGGGVVSGSSSDVDRPWLALEPNTRTNFNNLSSVFRGTVVILGSVFSTSNYNISDVRVKKNIIKSNSSSDLSILNNLEVSDYKFIDSLLYKNMSYKKLIAQQVENIYPQAVHRSVGFIPNIYRYTESIDRISNGMARLKFKHSLDSECIVGARVKFYNEDGVSSESTIKEIDFSSNSMVVDNFADGKNKIFVYGIEVNDFRNIDYNEIFMLNVSATQQLSKEFKELKNENDSLKTQIINSGFSSIKDLNKKIDFLQEENNALKKQIKMILETLMKK